MWGRNCLSESPGWVGKNLSKFPIFPASGEGGAAQSLGHKEPEKGEFFDSLLGLLSIRGLIDT